MNTTEPPIPAGFAPFPAYGPFGELVGPLWVRRAGQQTTVAMRQEVKHCNRAGNLHGGMFATLADTATNYAAMCTVEAPYYCVTTGFNCDLLSSAKTGNWIEARAQVVRAGKKDVCVNCLVYSDDEVIGRASATFRVVEPRTR